MFEEAEQTAQRLHRIAETQHGAYLAAAAALAQGRVCVASGRGDARACLNSALGRVRQGAAADGTGTDQAGDGVRAGRAFT